MVQRIGLITLNLPDLGQMIDEAKYLYCPDKNIVSLWDILLIAHA